MSILDDCPGEGYKLCRKKLHWYLPNQSGRGCPDCRKIYAKNKYHSDSIYRQNRIKSAKQQEKKNQAKYNARKRRRYQEDEMFREKRLAQINKRNREKWKNNKEWRNKKKEKVKQWIKENPAKRLAHEKFKQAKRKQRVAFWAKKSKIAFVYQEARKLSLQTGIKHHVDHIYPMISDYMCGLHVESNLQILTAEENCRKSNLVWPGQLDCQKGSIYDIFSKELTDLLSDQKN